MKHSRFVQLCFAVVLSLAAACPSGAASREPGISNSSSLVKPGATTNLAWQAPNKLSSQAVAVKLKRENSPFWLRALGKPTDKIESYIAFKKTRLDRNLVHDIVIRGSRRQKTIALTFDDGPHPGWTEKLIKTLQTQDVPATFFLVGRQAEKYPQLVQQIDDAGFTIGNHTYDHVSLLRIPRKYLPAEIIACSSIVKSITGDSPRYFRPPGGEYNEDSADAVEALGMKTILWTVDPADFAGPPAATIVHRVLQHASPGGIILLHDGIGQTITALPTIITTLRREGYVFVSVDELTSEKVPEKDTRATDEIHPKDSERSSGEKSASSRNRSASQY